MKVRLAALLLGLVLFVPSQAAAWWWSHPGCDPDSVVSTTTTIQDPNFGAYTVRKTTEVFAANNCGNPVPSPGSFTYVYTLEVLAESSLGIESFNVQIPGSGAVIDAGFVAGGGGGVVDPNSTVVGTADVRWFFDGTANGALLPGETSAPLYVVSPYQPGDGNVTVFGQFALDAPATCIVPSLLPEPIPCSTLFWKLRALNWPWFSHFFPGQQFGDLKTRAVQLSNGYFADEAELISALFAPGFLNVEKKARAQLAALLLNVAAGDLFPANTRCRLFPGTELDLDEDGTADSTVDEAITDVITGIESGDFSQQLDAFYLALGINLGKLVIGAASFH
jgi:hypothetical protein